MNAEYKKILHSIKMRQFAPVYLLDGEETYYLDALTERFENDIIPPHERDFNLIVLYGRDVDWKQVVNACRRYPMFAERQVVILKDAGAMKEFNELAGYIDNPSPTTVFVIEHRFKKADGKTRTVKLAKEKGMYFNSEKVKDDHIPGWIMNLGQEIGFAIGEREAQLLTTCLGNDLQKIINEIEKIRINVPEEKALTAAMIQRYIGVSRDYNLFELPDMLTSGNAEKFFRMLSYFISNTKSAPMPLMVATFYSHFNKLYLAHFMKGRQEKDVAAALGTFPSKAREIMAQTAQWPMARVERALLVIAKYSAMSVGINNAADDKELLKEFVANLME